MIKFVKKKRYVAEIAPTTKDLAKLINEYHVIPVPEYSDKTFKGLIVQPRGLIFLRPRKKRKPIEF